MERNLLSVRIDPSKDAASEFFRSGGHEPAIRIDINSPHILVVEDDPLARDMIIDHFRENGLQAVGAATAQEAYRHLSASGLSLIVLDLKLGEVDGLDLLREIRARSDVPVIITTGHRAHEIDRIIGLELGADDYIVKPFSVRELLARIRAVLRRQEFGRVARRNGPERGGFTFGDWRLHRRTRHLTDPNGVAVPLTKGEYGLLLAFLEAPQRPLSREYLLQATRIHEDVFDRSIDVQVLRLRRKLEADQAAPKIIVTERGFGYVFALSVEPI
jgi:two-component system, OmpR family, response regulator